MTCPCISENIIIHTLQVHSVIILLNKDLQDTIIMAYILECIIIMVAEILWHILAYHRPPYRHRLVGVTTENQDSQVLLSLLPMPNFEVDGYEGGRLNN